MCNFSEVIEENAIKKGMEQGVEQQKRKVIVNMYKEGFSYENIAEANEISIDEVKEYIAKSPVLE